jgi:peptide deformylase
MMGLFKKKTETLTLRFYGDPVLRKKAKPVVTVTPELCAFAEAMVDTMYASRGVGLAAPQVGKSLRLIVLDTAPPKGELPPDASPGEILLTPRMPLALVNPEVIVASKEKEFASEGCLSVPKIFADVERPAVVVLRASLLDGEKIEVECGGLLGRCIQHEIDHLDGVLFPDRLSKDEFGGIAGEVEALETKTKAALKKAKA